MVKGDGVSEPPSFLGPFCLEPSSSIFNRQSLFVNSQSSLSPHKGEGKGEGGRAFRIGQWLLVLLNTLLLIPHIAEAIDRTNPSLSNWGGFAINRDWTYDAIEKLVLSGLAGPTVLNTKPMSRLEMARVIEGTINRINEDERGIYNNLKDMEGVLEELIKEFQPELASLGVEPALGLGPPQPFYFFKPLDKMRMRIGYSEDDTALDNSQGESLGEGINAGIGLRSRAQIGDSFSFFVQPEGRLREGESMGRLVVGYAKLTLANVELEVGRDSLWWGPGYHGSFMLTNNSLPLYMVKISAAEPFIPPWIFKYLGPTKIDFFVARLEARRDYPHAMLSGLRVDFVPSRYVEIGASRMLQFGGKGRGLKGVDYLEAFFREDQGTGNRFDNNNLASIDMTIRVPGVGRYFPLARDLEVYGEIGGEEIEPDGLWPFRRAFFESIPQFLKFKGHLVGLFLTNFFGVDGMDMRLEYAQNGPEWYRHGVYGSGYKYKGTVMGHHMDRDAQDLYGRLTYRLDRDTLVGVELDREKRQGGAADEEKRQLGLDLSYRYSKGLAIFAAYRLERVENVGFIQGKDDTNHLLRLEATYSF